MNLVQHERELIAEHGADVAPHPVLGVHHRGGVLQGGVEEFYRTGRPGSPPRRVFPLRCFGGVQRCCDGVSQLHRL